MRQYQLDFNEDDTTPTNTGQFIVAIDVKVFADVDTFKRDVDRIVREMRSSDRLPDVDRIRVPGEGSAAAFSQRRRDGIPIPDHLLQTLESLAQDLAIPGPG